MKSALCLVAALTVLAVVVSPSSARADDDPALLDGGSVVSSTDGGAYAVADLTNRPAWWMTIRCEGPQSTRYKLCSALPCVPTGVNQLLDYDVTTDIPVNFNSGRDKRYLGLTTDDAGVPYCKVQKQ